MAKRTMSKAAALRFFRWAIDPDLDFTVQRVTRVRSVKYDGRCATVDAAVIVKDTGRPLNVRVSACKERGHKYPRKPVISVW